MSEAFLWWFFVVSINFGCLVTTSKLSTAPATWHFVRNEIDLTLMSMLVINVSSCRYLTFLFILKKCHRSVAVDFITFVVGAFKSLREGMLHFLEIFWRSLSIFLILLGLYIVHGALPASKKSLKGLQENSVQWSLISRNFQWQILEGGEYFFNLLFLH